jgi:spore coat polysaccharide biosynthesis protein SpsF (cytidylyltransferase family)
VRFHPEHFKQSLVVSGDDLSDMRVTVDYPDDLTGVEMVLKSLEDLGKIEDFTLDDIVGVWRGSTEIRARLGKVERDIARTRIIEEEGNSLG